MYSSTATFVAVCTLTLCTSIHFNLYTEEIQENRTLFYKSNHQRKKVITLSAEEVNRASLLKELFSEVEGNGDSMKDIIAKETVPLYVDPLLMATEGLCRGGF